MELSRRGLFGLIPGLLTKPKKAAKPLYLQGIAPFCPKCGAMFACMAFSHLGLEKRRVFMPDNCGCDHCKNVDTVVTLEMVNG